MEQKRKRTQVSIGATMVGVLVLGGAAYNVTRSGAELVVIYMTILGLAFLAVGIGQHRKAKLLR